MKIVKYQNRNKPIIFVAAVLLIVAGAIAGLYYFSQNNESKQESDINLNPPTEQESQAGKDIKQSSIDQSTDKSQSGSDPAPKPEPIEGSNKSSVGAKITATNYNNGILNVRTLIQTVTNDGTCELNMTGPNGTTYSASAGVQALPSSSTCKGFDVPTEKLSSGTWNITVNFSNDQLIATAREEVVVP